MRILIAEDEIRIREGIRKLFSKLGSEYLIVGEANDGLEGLEICRRVEPDLIITDVQMPNMNGLEMLEALYAEGSTARAIVLSAYSEFEYARSAMKLGVTEYLLKPVNLNDFSKALENIKRQIEEDKRKKPEKVGTPYRDFTEALRDSRQGRLFGSEILQQGIQGYDGTASGRLP